MINDHFENLVAHARKLKCGELRKIELPNGGALIRIDELEVEGWNRPTVNLLFLVPPGYPSGAPDSFWIEPKGLRLENGGTPINSNDGNPIPGDVDPERSTTWFSWHVESWNPGRDTLLTYFRVIQSRLCPAR